MRRSYISSLIQENVVVLFRPPEHVRDFIRWKTVSVELRVWLRSALLTSLYHIHWLIHLNSTMISTMSGGAAGVQGKVSDVKECAGCHKKIHDKHVLKVDIYWMIRDAFKKKNSIWRDIVPTRGGEGVKKCEMSLLKIPFY